jgi:phosphatidylglycerol:prolipoprotein diacylglycerol transferase
MIDPVIFSFELGPLTITLRWYGVLVMLGTLVGAWLTERELRRRGGNGEAIWDALLWVVPAGILGGRLWFVAQATISGSRYYLDDPIRILAINEGGLHIFGGFVLGAVTLLYYLRRNKLDPWLFLDSIAPAALIGQGIGRLANFINQELYGPPTNLPWGISIEAEHRLPQFSDLGQYPVETTRFHPTFAYEMAWNFLAATFLLWFTRQYPERMKPGAVFGGWLVLAGVGRAWIEFFRPDQPKIPGTAFSYSALFAVLMAVAGLILLLIRYGKLQPEFAEGWAEKYRIARPAARKTARSGGQRARRPAGSASPRGLGSSTRKKSAAKRRTSSS